MKKMSDDTVVDLSCLQEYTDGDPEAMQELIEAFYETAEDGLTALEENVVDGQSEAWSSAGHKLKGAAGYVGAAKLKSLCARAQDMKTASQDERADMFVQIKQSYGDVCKFLEELQS